MTFEDFKKSIHDYFSTDLPDPSRLFEGIRIESGHERLECLKSVEWPELSLEIIDFIAGEYWQLSNVWVKYYIPSVMLLTSEAQLEFNEHGEITDELDSLTTVGFSYWCSLQYFHNNHFDVSKNVFSGLTTSQIDVIQYWLNHIEFKGLDRAYELPENFDYSSEALDAYIKKMRNFSI